MWKLQKKAIQSIKSHVFKSHILVSKSRAFGDGVLAPNCLPSLTFADKIENSLPGAGVLAQPTGEVVEGGVE